jgi:hypothetical protein
MPQCIPTQHNYLKKNKNKTLIKKDLNRHFSAENMQTNKKHMKKF